MDIDAQELTVEVQQLDHALGVHATHADYELLLHFLICSIVNESILNNAICSLLDDLHPKTYRCRARPFLFSLDEDVTSKT